MDINIIIKEQDVYIEYNNNIFFCKNMKYDISRHKEFDFIFTGASFKMKDKGVEYWNFRWGKRNENKLIYFTETYNFIRITKTKEDTFNWLVQNG